MDTTTRTTGQQAIHATKVVCLSAIAGFVGLMVFIGILFVINPALDHQATPPAAPAVAAPVTQPAPQAAPAPAAPTATVDTPAGDGPTGCWNEPNKEMPTGYEMIEGPISAAPTGSIITNCPR